MLKEVPTPQARPYGIIIGPDNAAYFCEFGSNKIGKIDPKTGVKPNTLVAFDPKTRSFQSWPLPSGGGVVRNMVATPDDKLYLACSGVNKVAIAEVKH
jgi:virginiamycin B lyase